MTKTLIVYSPEDVDRELAIQAFSAISHVPDRRADDIIKSYVAEMAAMVETFTPFLTPENEGELKANLEKYRIGYLTKLNAWLQAQGRTMSAYIVGPANFPTVRNQKHNDTAHKRSLEFIEYREKGRLRLRRAYDPVAIAAAPISSDDGDAISKLRAKIDKAEAFQTAMKAANRIVRNKKLSDDDKVARLIKMAGIDENTAWKLLQPDFAGRLGFAPYQLSNNNANIRRMLARIAELETEAVRDGADNYEATILGTSVTISENRDENRLQLFFEGKPPPDVRKLLKSRGFRWAPAQSAWQRKLNRNARQVVELMSDIV